MSSEYNMTVFDEYKADPTALKVRIEEGLQIRLDDVHDNMKNDFLDSDRMHSEMGWLYLVSQKVIDQVVCVPATLASDELMPELGKVLRGWLRLGGGKITCEVHSLTRANDTSVGCTSIAILVSRK